MKLYSYFRSSAAYRMRIALNLKGLPYEMASIHLTRGGGQQRGRNFARSIRRCGCRRSTVERRRDLTQSLAIIEYLDDIHPKPPLLPPDPLDARRCAPSPRSSPATSTRSTTSPLFYLKNTLSTIRRSTPGTLIG